MSYKIEYACWTNVGKCRKINQDNYFCDGKYNKEIDDKNDYPLQGKLYSENADVLGVFDGMGGEECGEVASLIAAKCASQIKCSDEPLTDLQNYCETTNDRICEYMTENNVNSMGTTAAMLAFGKEEIILCNIGDSKIFKYDSGGLVQISTDHYAIAAFGKKPPLSQCLGIPKSEMIIEPYFSKGPYNDKDIYLICSDGLTDMVELAEISKILGKYRIKEAGECLMKAALENGGKDNITIIICRIEQERKGFFARLFGRQ